MAREPHFPADAKVGSGDDASAAAAAPAGGEAAAASSQARAHAAAAKSPEAKRNRHLMTGAAIGIGSAAIVAALLYAKGRNRP
jgi:hypothetical protein